MKALFLSVIIGLGALVPAQALQVGYIFQQDNWHIIWTQWLQDENGGMFRGDHYMNGEFLGNGTGATSVGWWGELNLPLVVGWEGINNPLVIGENIGSIVFGGVEYFAEPFTITQPTGKKYNAVPDAGSTVALLLLAMGGLHLLNVRRSALGLR